MFQNFYDIVIVLTQSDRKDRQKAFMRNAETIGLMYEWFYSLDMDTPRNSFNYSHYTILENCLKAGYQKVLVLEDDCAFINIDKFYVIHNQLTDWNWVYYGANVRPYPDHIMPTYHSSHLRVIRSAFTTHAIGYTDRAINAIVGAYNPSTGAMYDAWLDERMLPTIPAHITVPFLCVQQPSFSNLWNRNVDYSDTFKASEEYLYNIC